MSLESLKNLIKASIINYYPTEHDEDDTYICGVYGVTGCTGATGPTGPTGPSYPPTIHVTVPTPVAVVVEEPKPKKLKAVQFKFYPNLKQDFDALLLELQELKKRDPDIFISNFISTTNTKVIKPEHEAELKLFIEQEDERLEHLKNIYIEAQKKMNLLGSNLRDGFDEYDHRRYPPNNWYNDVITELYNGHSSIYVCAHENTEFYGFMKELDKETNFMKKSSSYIKLTL
jgi:hypothetical protein